ncbi:MAG: hypothetical protein Q4G33_14115 [bacterium]|nr:hypothetical protein [bacterium]
MKNTRKPRSFKSRLTLRIVLTILVITAMMISFLRADYYSVFLCALTLILFDIPAFVDRRLNIALPSVLEATILLFIFAAEILGEIGSFYTHIPWWDTMLHTINGFIMAAIGFSLVDILNNSPRFHINMSPIFVALVSFCFSMTVGVVWEFFEYSADLFAKTDMQKDFIINSISSVALNPDGLNDPVKITGITDCVIHYIQNGAEMEYVISGGYLDIGINDTMKDLLVNCIGAVSFSLYGYLYSIGRGKVNLFKMFSPHKKQFAAQDNSKESLKKGSISYEDQA